MALAAILLWYLGIGVLAAVGAVTISRARFSPRIEHIFFACLLILIAAMYLAFVAYFGDHSAPGGRRRCKPEYDDVHRVALATGRPASDIFWLAADAAERAS